ncbi:MAG: hypothetical protein QNJ27_05800 [Simkaniaceae bacterium]|nr:hypothetical protein [Simkaniaceae bacterium]
MLYYNDAVPAVISIPNHGLTLPSWGVLPLNRQNALATADSHDNCAFNLAIALPDSKSISFREQGFLKHIHGLSPQTNYYLSPDTPGAIIAEADLPDDCYRQLLFSSLDEQTIKLSLNRPLPPKLTWAKLLNVQQTDLNSSAAGTQAQFQATVLGNSRFFSANSSGMQINVAGNYDVSASFYGTAAGGIARTNVAIRISVNGITIDNGDTGASSYIRRSNGANEAGSIVQDYVTVQAGDIVGFKGFLLGNTGVVTAPAGRSSLKVKIL